MNKSKLIVKYVSLAAVLICLGYLITIFVLSILNAPLDIKITNLTSNSATISWVTKSPAKGVVFFKDKGQIMPWFLAGIGAKKDFDDRDSANAQIICMEKLNADIAKKVDSQYSTNSDTTKCAKANVTKVGKYYVHHVTLTELDDEHAYIFGVGNGVWSWKPSVSTFKTFAVAQNVSSPIPLFGKVAGPNKDYSNDSIVYIKFKNSVSGLESIEYSGVTNENGGWYVDGANLRQSNGDEFQMEQEEGTFIANAQFKNLKLSGDNQWLFGSFDGAFPDIQVKNDVRSSKKGVVLSTLAYDPDNPGGGNNGGANNPDKNKNKGGKKKFDCGSMPPGKCLKAAAAANGGELTPEVMASTGICGELVETCNAVQYAGNASVVAQQPITTASISNPDGSVKKTVKTKKDQNGNPIQAWDYQSAGCTGQQICAFSDALPTTPPPGGGGEDEGGTECAFGGTFPNCKHDKSEPCPSGKYNPDGSCSSGGAGTSACITGQTCGCTGKPACANDPVAETPITVRVNVQGGDASVVVNGSGLYPGATSLIIPPEIVKQLETQQCGGHYPCEINVTPLQVNLVALLEANPDLAAQVRAGQVNIPGLEDAIKKQQADLTGAANDIANAVKNYNYKAGKSTATPVAPDSVEASASLPVNTNTIVYKNGKPNQIINDMINNCADANGCTTAEANELIFQLNNNSTNVNSTNAYKVTMPNSGNVNVVYYPGDAYWQQQQQNLNNDASGLNGLNSPSSSNFLPNIESKAMAATNTIDDGYILFLPEFGMYSLQLGDFDFKTETTAQNTAYIFYIETNGQTGFQAPADIDHPKASEDRLIKSNSYKINFDKKASARKYSLRKGLNIISFDFIAAGNDGKAYTAEDLIKDAKSKGVNVEYITYFDGGRWLSGMKCKGACGGNNFPILPGRGYLVKVSSNSTLSVPAYNLKNSIPINFSAGWNLIGVHGYKQNFTAKSLITSINKVDGLTADNVTWYPTAKGRYEGLQITDGNEYGFDYPISSQTGYFVRIRKFAPKDKACKSIIWHLGGVLDGVCGDSKNIF